MNDYENSSLQREVKTLRKELDELRKAHDVLRKAYDSSTISTLLLSLSLLMFEFKVVFGG